MKKQKHFANEQEILDAIDLAIELRNTLRIKIDQGELEIQRLAKEDGTIRSPSPISGTRSNARKPKSQELRQPNCPSSKTALRPCEPKPCPLSKINL